MDEALTLNTLALKRERACFGIILAFSIIVWLVLIATVVLPLITECSEHGTLEHFRLAGTGKCRL